MYITHGYTLRKLCLKMDTEFLRLFILAGELFMNLPYSELMGSVLCFGQIAVTCVRVPCPTVPLFTKLTACATWRRWICAYCVSSSAWNPQSSLVRTSSSVIRGCAAVGSLHKATSNNRRVWLRWHEGWRLMKWNCCVWADFHKPNSPLLLFLVSLHFSG